MIRPRIIIQIGWAVTLPDVKPPLSQILNTIALYKARALVLERCQHVCWDYWFGESAGIQNKGKNQIPSLLQKRNTDFLYQRHLCASSHAAFQPHLQTLNIVLKSLWKTQLGSTAHRDAEEPARVLEALLHIRHHLLTGDCFAHLPSPQVSLCPPSFHLPITNISTQAFCSRALSLCISKGWCFLSPSASKFFSISDLSTLSYTSETRSCTMMLSFTSSVHVHSICISLSYYLLFHTEFCSQEIYELSNIHERALKTEGTASSAVQISDTNDGGEVVYGSLINFLLPFNQLLGIWGFLKV